MKYDNPEEGEWINPVMEGYKMACCDCGLVHKINYRTYSDEDGNQRIEYQAFRDNRATGQIRRHMKVSSQADLLVMQKTADIEFLVNRTMKAGTCNFTSERDTGMSSNSIVAIAYGIQKLEQQILPSDMGDLNACRNMWKKLPEHRKTEDAKKAMENAENFRNR